MTKYTLLKFKEGKKQQWVHWCNYIMQNYAEAVETLKEEDLVRERCVVFGDYLVYEHQSVEGKEKKPANMEKEINKKHFEVFHECLERVELGTLGYDVKVKV